MKNLNELNCRIDKNELVALSPEECDTYLQQLNHWSLAPNQEAIVREFHFKNYYHTMNFVNAISWIANKEAHHPDMEVSYGRCLVKFSTHDIGNKVSIKDMICAAKVDALIDVGSFGPTLVEG